MTALILPKLGMCRDKDEAEARLIDLGATEVGSGCYATVYRIEVGVEGKPSFDPREYLKFNSMYDPARMRLMPIPVSVTREKREARIIKVCRRDPGGLIAAKAAMLTKDYDPLAPRYYGITEFGGGGWMGELEPLKNINTYSDYRETMGHSNRTAHLTGGTREPTAEVFNQSIYMRIVRDMMQAYRSSGKGCANWDIHGENVMLRGNQPVITDPVSATGG